MYSPILIGACLLIAAMCLEVAEKDNSQKQMVSIGLYRLLLSSMATTERFLNCKMLILIWLSQMGRVATSMVLLYHVFFGLGFSTVPWVYSAEVNSLGWRTRGAAAATSVNWIGGFVVVQITKVGLDHLQWRFFLSKFTSFFLVYSRQKPPLSHLLLGS